MKFLLKKFFLLFSLWILFCSFVDFEYKNIKTKNPLSIHILEVNPKKYEIKPTTAKENEIGRENVLNISKKQNAKAAINGGFFKIGGKLDGLPMGVLKIDGNWVSLPRKQRGSFGWNKDFSTFIFDQIDAKAFIIADNIEIPIDGINRERKEKEKILYFNNFFNIYQTNPENMQSFMILSNNFFLALDVNDETAQSLKYNAFDYKINIIPKISPDDQNIWENIDHIVNGTPLLIKDREKISDFSPEKITIETFLTKKHARTAVGIKENGNLIFLVVDGNNPFYSIGMTIQELQDFMFSLDCIHALNLDGGGSSTMVIDGKIINHPEGDEDEDIAIRKVSDAILILEKEE